MLAVAYLQFTSCTQRPEASLSSPASAEHRDNLRMLQACQESVVRVEFVALGYGPGESIERVGPVVVSDEAALREFRTALSGVASIRPNNEPSYDSELHVAYLTIVYQGVSQVRCRVVGNSIVFFDNERSLGTTDDRLPDWIQKQSMAFARSTPDGVLKVGK
ncbi:hypothetical protein NA78x_000028 [Anatilimnocola sp. NA78]|uniref:hypothetical protein n=1 Tax=Anatilimnocola sp. NA78 TaxID=3415683 RepID=UPI003CE5076B